MYDLENIISQFADDTQLFTEDEEGLDCLIHKLEYMRGQTGLTVNYEKSSIHPIGGAPILNIRENFVWDPGGPYVLGIHTDQNGNEVFDNLMNKVETIINKWQNRRLSLTGKILLINTLMASLFVYPMQVHTNPDDSRINKFERTVHAFLWGKTTAKAKIPYDVLKAMKNLGGLKLVDIRNKCDSLKVGWIFRREVFVEEIWKSYLPKSLNTLIWDCYILKQHYYLFNHLPTFWGQVCTAWFSFHTSTFQLQNVSCLLNMVLWWNSEITVDKKPLYNDKCIKAGLTHLYDIIDHDGKLYSYQDMCTKYGDGVLTWFEYTQLIHAIPKNWSEIIRNDKRNLEWQSNFRHIMHNVSKPVSYVYNKITQFAFQPINVQINKINKVIEVGSEELLEAFCSIYVITNITKYRDFQFRLLNCAIYFNDRLYHWKKVNTQACEYCGETKQNTRHFYGECPQVLIFFQKLEEFMTIDMCCEIAPLTLRNVLLNNIHKQKAHLCNTLLLMAKNYLFCCKCQGKEFKFVHFLWKVQQLYQCELYNAKKSGKECKHYIKWSPLNPIPLPVSQSQPK